MVLRPLSSGEIEALQQDGCWAEDWSLINVADDFQPLYMHNVTMYGEVNIGSQDKSIEVAPGFLKHSGIYNAVLCNVTVGDDCLIENIGNHIYNYTISEECYLSNIGTLETNEGATYGEGNVLSLLNEAGEGNVMLFCGLSSQLAAFMVKHAGEKEVRERLFQLVKDDVMSRLPECGQIGTGVKMVNCKEITNCVIGDYCELRGAERLADCSLMGDATGGTYIGAGVIAENTIVDYDASLTDACRLKNCFVGEACQIGNGFSAEQSVFFANSQMGNGEACAAFCGPFSVSHHKSSLLIGAQYSFYNAGSATNFSNHAYKMGPIHWGTLERGSKTASGSYLFLPARLGVFSVLLGKSMGHPDTSRLPFSYVIGEGDRTVVIPGRNLLTCGFWRDVEKWPKRDYRPAGHRKSLVRYDWLSPYVLREVITGRDLLVQLETAQASDDSSSDYTWQNLTIPRRALKKGLACYEAIIKMYLGRVAENSLTEQDRMAHDEDFIHDEPSALSPWTDLGGMLLPQHEEQLIVQQLLGGEIESIGQLSALLQQAHEAYERYDTRFALSLLQQEYGVVQPTPLFLDDLRQQARQARQWWQDEVEKDARKEYALGDVDESALNDFVKKIKA